MAGIRDSVTLRPVRYAHGARLPAARIADSGTGEAVVLPQMGVNIYPESLSLWTGKSDWMVGDIINTNTELAWREWVAKAKFSGLRQPLDVTKLCVFDPPSGTVLTEPGPQTVTASYTENGVTVSASVVIDVADWILTGIRISSPPTKTAYVVGETLDLTGCVVTASFRGVHNYQNKNVDVTASCMFSPANGAALSTEGSTRVTATYSYGGVTMSAGFDVVVGVQPVGTELYITLTSDLTKSLYFVQSAQNGVTVDWGDGSEEETFGGVESSLVSGEYWVGKEYGAPAKHTYAAAGDYVITLTPAIGVSWRPGVHEWDTYNILGTAHYKSGTSPELTDVVLGNGCSILDDGCFGVCTSLVSITIPDGITQISDSAFEYCDLLAHVSIGAGVSDINGYVFDYCPALSQVDVDVNNPNIKSVNGVVFTKDGSALLLYPQARTGSYAVPNGVATIGMYAFWQSEITAVDLGSAATLAYGAFENSKIGSIDLTNVVAVGGYAFAFTRLSSLVFPTASVVCGAGAFTHCSSLTGLLTVPHSFDISQNGSIFSGTGITGLVVSGSVGEQCFQSCTALESVTLSSGVVKIGFNAFKGCTALESVAFPGSVVDVGNSAFEGCTALESVAFAQRITTIGSSAFKGCTALGPEIEVIADSVKISAFGGCTGLVRVVVNVRYLEYDAFKDCVNIEKIWHSYPGDSTVGYAEYYAESGGSGYRGPFYKCTKPPVLYMYVGRMSDPPVGKIYDFTGDSSNGYTNLYMDTYFNQHTKPW